MTEIIRNYDKSYILGVVCAIMLSILFVLTLGGVPSSAATTVPGHTGGRTDKDNNGISDAGVFVNGHYTSVYAYDNNGDYYWDLGDGRVYKTVPTIDDLDQATLTTCDYVNNYRADFGNDPYMNTGWIQNHIKCHGYDDNGTYNYLIVHKNDPRYTGNPDWAVWGDWEYRVLTQSGDGNLVKAQPQTNL